MTMKQQKPRFPDNIYLILSCQTRRLRLSVWSVLGHKQHRLRWHNSSEFHPPSTNCNPQSVHVHDAYSHLYPWTIRPQYSPPTAAFRPLRRPQRAGKTAYITSTGMYTAPPSAVDDKRRKGEASSRIPRSFHISTTTNRNAKALNRKCHFPVPLTTCDRLGV